jgi:TPR repeat protein
MAWYYFSGTNGFPRDPAKAAPLAMRACSRSRPEACNVLALCYQYGTGVEVSRERADRFYELACDGGSMSACNNWAGAYRDGSGAIPQDRARAAAMYKRQCDRGDVGNCGWYGDMLYQGMGVPEDKDTGAELLRRACHGGDQQFCRKLDAYGLGAPTK